jgi:hypothetical protein
LPASPFDLGRIGAKPAPDLPKCATPSWKQCAIFHLIGDRRAAHPIKTRAPGNWGKLTIKRQKLRPSFLNFFSNCQKPARLTRHIHPQARANAQTRMHKRTRAMKTNKRFIKGVVEAAAKNDTVMPWARGARRAAFIAKRNAAEPQRKSA